MSDPRRERRRRRLARSVRSRPGTRCPVFRRRDSHLGFRTELETLVGHAKGKGTSGGPARLKVPMGQSGADRPIVVTRRGNARGAKGVGHSRCLLGQRETGGTQLFHRKAPAFVEWHEPDEARVSRPDRGSPVRVRALASRSRILDPKDPIGAGPASRFCVSGAFKPRRIAMALRRVNANLELICAIPRESSCRRKGDMSGKEIRRQAPYVQIASGHPSAR